MHAGKCTESSTFYLNCLQVREETPDRVQKTRKVNDVSFVGESYKYKETLARNTLRNTVWLWEFFFPCFSQMIIFSGMFGEKFRSVMFMNWVMWNPKNYKLLLFIHSLNHLKYSLVHQLCFRTYSFVWLLIHQSNHLSIRKLNDFFQFVHSSYQSDIRFLHSFNQLMDLFKYLILSTDSLIHWKFFFQYLMSWYFNQFLRLFSDFRLQSLYFVFYLFIHSSAIPTIHSSITIWIHR